MGHFHGHSDDVNGRAVHELLMVVERGRHAKEPAGGVGGSASRRRERRDLEIVRHGLQRGNVRLGGPSAIRIRADDADADPLGAADARRHHMTAQATAAASAALITSTSRASLTSSLTSSPPVSSATFQVSPQSLRLIAVYALKPACTPPIGSFA